MKLKNTKDSEEITHPIISDIEGFYQKMKLNIPLRSTNLEIIDLQDKNFLNIRRMEHIKTKGYQRDEILIFRFRCDNCVCLITNP